MTGDEFHFELQFLADKRKLSWKNSALESFYET